VHPAVPHMDRTMFTGKRACRSRSTTGSHEGYQTDKTQVYWLGEQRPSSPGPGGAGLRPEIQARIAEDLKPGSGRRSLGEKPGSCAEERVRGRVLGPWREQGELRGTRHRACH
jgi:hypothetical protein